MVIKEMIGKSLYAMLFNLLLPGLLIIWAVESSSNVNLPVISLPGIGILLTALGFFLVVSGMLSIVVWGKGLPMNTYPPKNFVTRGIFRCIPHPVYTGAVITSAGVSILFESSSAFWLVTPVLGLSCTALVFGYEREDIIKRFGDVRRNCLIKLPENSSDKAGKWDYISAYAMVFLPWFVFYELICLMGTNEYSLSTFMKFEYSVPVIEWTEIFYILTYPFVMIVPLVFREKGEIRNFCVAGITATLVGIFLQLTIPFMAPPKPFVPNSFWGNLIELERNMDSAAAAFPSFHVIWAFTAAYFYSMRFNKRMFWYVLAILISASCFTTGMHSLIDIIAGFATFLIIINIEHVTRLALRFFEMIANSWREWDFGHFRVLNHGIYVGVGSAAGYLIISALSGRSYAVSVFYVAIFVIIFAGLWAQIVEGSPKLSRPFGFYGGLIGAVAGIIVVSSLTGQGTGLLLGSYALAAPWIQISGRFRCLIQGCCHGKEIHSGYGIKFHHPRSRVCRLSNLTNKSLHPTQLYSILANVLSGIFLIRLWYENLSPEFIAGIYLILNGLSRFVEESYRGEPQTPIFGGLRLYQWLAITSVLAGAYMTTIPSSAVWPEVQLTSEQFLYSIITGLITFFAMGVDFPKSNKRFARLA